MARFLRRQVTYALRPPVAFPPAASALSQPVQTHLSRAPRPRSQSRLSAPAVVFSAYTPFGPKTPKAAQPRQGRQSHYVLHPPATLVQAAAPFLASPPRIYGTATKRATQQHPAGPILFPPTIVDAAAPTVLPPVPGLSRKLARPPRQTRVTTSRLRPPAVVAPAVVIFTAPPESLSFRIAVRRATEQHFVTSSLFPPEVIDPLPAAPGLTRKLARSPRQGRVTRFKLIAPATLVQPVPPFRPLQTVYATATRRAVEHHGSAAKLQPPAVVSIPSGDNPVGSVFDPNYFLILHP